MQRRLLCAQTALFVAGSTLLVPPLAQAQAKAPQAGVEFIILDPAVPGQVPAGKVELIEFFGYFCPHCNAFEPVLSPWVKQLPGDVVFRRIPVAFSDSSVPQQRLYFALQAMGLIDKLHARVFEAIHVKKINLNRGEAITDWVVQQGVDRAAFTIQFTSFAVATQASRAVQLTQAYRVDGVPALGVAGRFYTDGALTGGMDRLLRVAEFLIDQARAAR
ncbi:MAG: thiol:disulfide interchange protein DsbA/DsbL [Rhodoferax sp.]|nr:thiol:disulfide interchange protein DsbA/DsbL [Rhodoferax sp.]